MDRTDDLGNPYDGPPVAQRVVSLVPSITEALATDRPEALVGATDWCTHPADLDVRRLRDSGVRVWVTDVETVPDAVASLERLYDAALGWPRPEWLVAARDLWDRPLPPVRGRVAVPIWRDPWMVVGARTYAGDLLRRLGWENAFGSGEERYPKVELAEIDRPDLDLVLLPDEPYVFTDDDGPEAFAVAPTRLVSGRLLTWYCLLYTSPSPRDKRQSRMPSSA